MLNDYTITRFLITSSYDSPDNTYIYKGLPQADCLSLVDGMMRTECEMHDYIFLLPADFSGYTILQTLREHNRFASDTRESLTGEKIFGD
jgi:cell division protein YceG involved in septum cleavage